MDKLWMMPGTPVRYRTSNPVMSEDELTRLGKRILDMTTTDSTTISVVHTARTVTRLANGQVLSCDDGDSLELGITGKYGGRAEVTVETNQSDDATIRAIIARLEDVAHQRVGGNEPIINIPEGPRDIPRVDTWKETTVRAMTDARGTVIPAMLEPVRNAKLLGSGFIGFLVRSSFVMHRSGLTAFYQETDCECTVSARTVDGKGSGWSGQANRDWSQISPATIAARAIDLAQRGAAPHALEPGRRVAILSPEALVQIFRYMSLAYDAYSTDNGATPFSKSRFRGGNKLGQRVFDPRLTMLSDASDPLGGYQPFYGARDYDGIPGLPTPPMRWVENGILKNLAYRVDYGLSCGKPYSQVPWSMHVTPVAGTPTMSIEQMIAACQEGIYVNRFSSVDILDRRTGMLTGVTRDGCFFIKNGKIDRAVKNFRFTDSPFIFLNNIEAIGTPVRAAFGYTPRNVWYDRPGETSDWPRRPIIVPPMMIRDFNFTALSDAV